MAKKIEWCQVSAYALALGIVAENPELANKIADLSEYANAASLRHDALVEWAMQWIEWDIKELTHHYSLKEESADMMLSSAIFGWVLANTRQGDEALRIIADEIKNTNWTAAEGIDLYRMIQNMDLSNLTDVAKTFTEWDLKEAKEIVDNIQEKLSYYVWTDYSIVRSGSKVKVAAAQKKLEKEYNEAQKLLDDATETLWEVSPRTLKKDYDTIKKYRAYTTTWDYKYNWRTPEGQAEIRKIWAKYWLDTSSAKTVEQKLEKLMDAKKTIDENKDIAKRLKKEYEDAMKWDLKLIEDWKNPINMVSWDEERRFNKWFNANPSDRVMQYGQYVLSRALLTWGKDVPQEIYDTIVKAIESAWKWTVVNFLDEHLDEDWIMDESRTLEELLARAYTNPMDLVNSWELRAIYRQRLIELASDGVVSTKDAAFIESLMNTFSFSKAWAGFSDVLKSTDLLRAAQDLWLSVPGNNWEKLWESIVNLYKRDDFSRAIIWDFVKLWNWMELTTRQLLELTTQMLNNTNINKLIASEAFTDKDILAIAWKYLIWDAKLWGERLKSLFELAQQAPATSDTRWVVLKTITGRDIATDAKVGFFDFRKWLTATESTKARAEFQDALAWANTLTIPTNRLPDLTDNLEKKISEFKGWYILVNDAQWKMNDRLVKAIDNVNHWPNGERLPIEERVQVIYPRWWFMWTIKTKWWKLIYQTSYTEWFNELVRKVAIRSLGQADVDTSFTEELQKKLLRWDVDALKEYNDMLELSAHKYFGEMFGLWEEAYKDKLPAMLEEATWISFKNYDSITNKADFWKRVDNNFMLWTKTVGKYEQEFTTIADVMKRVDSLLPDELVNRLNNLYGFDFTLDQISEWGKIKQVVRDAYLNYELSQTPLELLERKWKLLSVINGWTADNIGVSQFKAMLQSNDFSAYKELFFHNPNMSDEELAKYAKKINDMIFDGLCAEVAMNLVKTWYQLPLVNVRDLVHDYLMDKLNVNWTFARAFLYKNGLPDNLETLKSITNEAMPSELRFGYDDWFKYEVANHWWHAYHETFKLDYSWSWEWGAAHWFGVYVTREDPERSTMYATKWMHKDPYFQEVRYKWKSRDDLVNYESAHWWNSLGAEMSVAEDLLSAMKWYDWLKFEEAVKVIQSDYENEVALARKFYAEKGDELDLRMEKVYQERLDTLKNIRKEDFDWWYIAREKVKQAPTYNWLTAEWYKKLLEEDDDLFYMWMRYILEDLEYSPVKERWRKTFEEAKNDYITGVKMSLGTAEMQYKEWMITKKQFLEDKRKSEKVIKKIEALTPDDFNLPGFRHSWYFYKLEVPDYIKTWADTPNGANYLDDARKIYDGAEFFDEDLISDVADMLENRWFNMDYWDALYNIIESKYLKKLDRGIREDLNEEDLYDIVSDILGSQKDATELFSELWYKWLEYTWWLDGRCRVIYNDADVDVLVIYDNRYKIPVYKKPWLDESKYLVEKEVYAWLAHFNKDEAEKVLSKIIDDEVAGFALYNAQEVYNGFDWALLREISKLFKVSDWYEDFSRLVNDWFAKMDSTNLPGISTWHGWMSLNWYREDLAYSVMAALRDNKKYYDALDKTFVRPEKLKYTENELTNFNSPSMFQLKSGDDLWWVADPNDVDMFYENALLIKDFKNKRTLKDIAKAYWVPINAVDVILTPTWLEAYGRYWNQIIDIVKNVKWSTVPHEIFHAVFGMVDPSTYRKIIKDGTNLFQIDKWQLEEMLADEFSKYLRTWKFTYWDAFKQLAKDWKWTKADEKWFVALIKKVFQKAKEWLWLVDNHSKEVQSLFDDILDLKYARNPDVLIPDWYTRMVEVPNKFVEDTYSSLIAMSAVKNGDKLPWLWQEAERLQSILDNYLNALSEATLGWKTLTFAEAQKLKAKAGYALDMFEQDYLLPKYKQFLTPQERQELFWLKYWLAITTDTEWLATIREYNDAIMQRYRDATSSIASRNEVVASWLEWQSASIQKEIMKRQQQLMEEWATIKVVNWSAIVVDTRDELLRQLNSIPSTIAWLENLKAMWRVGLNQLTNEEAYFLLNVVELAKNADNKANMIMQTIYKVKPQLARLDFFNTYKAIDWIPKILSNNLLTSTKYLSKFDNTLDFDQEVKKTILKMIKEQFARDWRLVRNTVKKKGKVIVRWLDSIVEDAIDVNIKKLSNSIKGFELKRFKKNAGLVYLEAYTPYTYLEDVPSVVKDSISNILAEQEKWIRQALDLLWDDNKLTDIMDNISIYTQDWTVKTFRELLDWDTQWISKIVFDTDSAIIGEADVLATTTIDPKLPKSEKLKLEKENERIIKEMENNYRDWLQAYLNQSEVIWQAERDLTNTILVAARECAKKYTLTNKFVETDNALASINEEIVRRFKSDVLWLKWLMTKWGQLMWWVFDFWWRISSHIMDRWKLVQERYKAFYQMPLSQLANLTVSWSVDAMALNMVKYFKEMEQRLWSLDWLKWVSTDININKAFAHIGEVVMNIDSITWLYSLMSGIEWNQFLKFFRFSNTNQPSYVKRFVIWDEWKETIWWFRTYVDKRDDWLNKDWFNQTFWANFSDREYAKVVQALSWFTIINKKFKALENALNFMNTSNFLFRTLVSYPWQLVSIANQSIAYFLRQIGWERELWIEDLWAIDAIRHDTWILNWTYNELDIWEALKRVFSKASPDDVNPYAFYNRYWVPDVDDLMKNEKFYTSDDLNTIYSKIDNYWATRTWKDKVDDLWVRFLRNVDAYKDNANNIIDWLFARNFKNIAFVRALQSNQVMKFATADQFARFMAWDAPAIMKKRVMDAVTAESWRNFRNILGLGFSWLDRALWWWPISNTFIGMMQILNFRWAWWMNIARQTNNIFMTARKIAFSWMSKEAKDAAATLIAKSPEFVNFASQLYTDLKNAWKLVRFQDNGQIPPDNEEWSIIDFVDYAAQNMEFASQRWQWIQSYWTARVGLAWIEWAVNNWKDPEIYRDTLWVWAFFNALAKNAWRNWKAPNFMMKVLATASAQWWPAAWEYVGNEFWKLSFWTLRYLMNEDQTDYGFSTELPQKKVWIPFILTWQADETWDKAFSYDLAWTETFQNLASWRDAKRRWDQEAANIYRWNLVDTAFNSSQMLWVVKSTWRMLNGLFDWETISKIFNELHMYEMGNPFSAAEAADIIGETKAWAEFLKNWYYIPDDADWMKTFVDTIIWQADFRPGNDGFNKSLFNFDKSWHMKNFDESSEKDAAMELLLNNMKYQRDENWGYVLDEKGNKIVTDYWKHHMADITSKAYDVDLMTQMNFDFINNWVEANNKDPNYMLYRRLIWEWIAWNYLASEADRYINQFNTVYWLKKTKKLTLTELKNSIYYDEFIPHLLATTITIGGENVLFPEALATLDKEALMDADIAIIEDELSKMWQKDVISKFFNVDKETWAVTLSTKYKSFIEEQAKLSWYLQNGDIDSFMAETALVTKMFRKADPYGLMTTALISSRTNWINQSQMLTDEQKAKAINVLFTDNADFIQQHIPELIESLGDKAEAYITQMNEFIYGDNIIANQLVQDNETSNSSSWRKSALNAAKLASWLLEKLSKASWGSSKIWPKTYNYNYVPVKLDWAKLLRATGWRWYSGTTAWFNVIPYKHHTDLSLKKDVNRNVKWPKTQALSNKKQLSSLEKKATEALEAES